MNNITSFIPFVLIIGLIALVLYIVINKREDKAEPENSEVLKLKYQAFERIALFLERIKTDALVLRHMGQTDNATELQYTLIQEVRNEFNHNIAQQVYFSHNLWEQIRQAKDEVLSCVSLAASDLSLDKKAVSLSKKIIDSGANSCDLTIINTLKLLKEELNKQK